MHNPSHVSRVCTAGYKGGLRQASYPRLCCAMLHATPCLCNHVAGMQRAKATWKKTLTAPRLTTPSLSLTLVSHMWVYGVGASHDGCPPTWAQGLGFMGASWSLPHGQQISLLPAVTSHHIKHVLITYTSCTPSLLEPAACSQCLELAWGLISVQAPPLVPNPCPDSVPQTLALNPCPKPLPGPDCGAAAQAAAGLCLRRT